MSQWVSITFCPIRSVNSMANCSPPRVSSSSIPSSGDLKRSLRYDSSMNEQASREFEKDFNAFRYSYEASNGNRANEIHRWKEDWHELCKMATTFLDIQGKGAYYWPEDEKHKNYRCDLIYSKEKDKEFITQAIIQFCFIRNNSDHHNYPGKKGQVWPGYRHMPPKRPANGLRASDESNSVHTETPRRETSASQRNVKGGSVDSILTPDVAEEQGENHFNTNKYPTARRIALKQGDPRHKRSAPDGIAGNNVPEKRARTSPSHGESIHKDGGISLSLSKSSSDDLSSVAESLSPGDREPHFGHAQPHKAANIAPIESFRQAYQDRSNNWPVSPPSEVNGPRPSAPASETRNSLVPDTVLIPQSSTSTKASQDPKPIHPERSTYAQGDTTELSKGGGNSENTANKSSETNSTLQNLAEELFPEQDPNITEPEAEVIPRQGKINRLYHVILSREPVAITQWVPTGKFLEKSFEMLVEELSLDEPDEVYALELRLAVETGKERLGATQHTLVRGNSSQLCSMRWLFKEFSSMCLGAYVDRSQPLMFFVTIEPVRRHQSLIPPKLKLQDELLQELLDW